MSKRDDFPFGVLVAVWALGLLVVAGFWGVVIWGIISVVKASELEYGWRVKLPPLTETSRNSTPELSAAAVSRMTSACVAWVAPPLIEKAVSVASEGRGKV
jgi:hypothetical protein